jgi:hypothetical protein
MPALKSTGLVLSPWFYRQAIGRRKTKEGTRERRSTLVGSHLIASKPFLAESPRSPVFGGITDRVQRLAQRTARAAVMPPPAPRRRSAMLPVFQRIASRTGAHSYHLRSI